MGVVRRWHQKAPAALTNTLDLVDLVHYRRYWKTRRMTDEPSNQWTDWLRQAEVITAQANQHNAEPAQFWAKTSVPFLAAALATTSSASGPDFVAAHHLLREALPALEAATEVARQRGLPEAAAIFSAFLDKNPRTLAALEVSASRSLENEVSRQWGSARGLTDDPSLAVLLFATDEGSGPNVQRLQAWLSTDVSAIAEERLAAKAIPPSVHGWGPTANSLKEVDSETLKAKITDALGAFVNNRWQRNLHRAERDISAALGRWSRKQPGVVDPTTQVAISNVAAPALAALTLASFDGNHEVPAQVYRWVAGNTHPSPVERLEVQGLPKAVAALASYQATEPELREAVTAVMFDAAEHVVVREPQTQSL